MEAPGPERRLAAILAADMVGYSRLMEVDEIIEYTDIFGDGVNLATRLEVLAEPGGICVSGAVRDQVNHRLDDIAFEDIGEQNVKNITRPIHVFRVRLEPNAAEAHVSGK